MDPYNMPLSFINMGCDVYMNSEHRYAVSEGNKMGKLYYNKETGLGKK